MKTPKAWITICLAAPLLFLSEISIGQSGGDNLSVTARGTGRTTGHIATLTVRNTGDQPVTIDGQMVYIPSDGKHQSYIGRIPEGTTIPPGGMVEIPVSGYCADVHLPPVPSGESMPPLEDWIPVSAPTVPEPMNPPGASGPPSVPEPMNPPGASDPPSVPEPMNPPGASDPPSVPEPMNPPGASDPPSVPEPMNPPGASDPPSVPEPMNPPGASDPPSVPEPMNPPGASDPPSVPEPMNPPGGNTPPDDGILVNLIPETGPAPDVTPEAWGDYPAFNPRGVPSPETVATWPGTDIPVGGTINPAKEPRMYGHVLASVITQIENAVDVIQHESAVTTPFANDPVRESEAIIQQTFWMWTAVVTGEEYTDDDFAERVYDQFETSMGTPVASLPDEQKEVVDSGIADFWLTFQATGVEAKVISVESPGIDIGNQVMATVASRPACKCLGISYHLEVKRGGVVVHSDSHTSRDNPKVSIANFKYGDVLDIKITDIDPDCQCDGAECEHFPAESQNPNSPKYMNTDTSRAGQVDIEMENDPAGEIGSKGNNNCQHKDAEWNADADEYSFTLETRDEKTNARGVFQRLRIKAYCQLDDCRRTLCAKTIQLNFVTAR